MLLNPRCATCVCDGMREIGPAFQSQIGNRQSQIPQRGCTMTQTLTKPEQDLRLRLLNTLLTTPHRKLDQIQAVHAGMVKEDPRFYVRLASWYFAKGDVRDHKEMFVVTLVLSNFPGHRDVGLALLRQLPPYE